MVHATDTSTVLLGLDGFVLLAATEHEQELVLLVETTADRDWCRDCGVRAGSKGRARVTVRDVPVGDRPVTLVWKKRIWRCEQDACPRGSWRETQLEIRPRAVLTERARRWATVGSASRRSRSRRSRTISGSAGTRVGNDERMGFLYNTRRVKRSGLACELVVPPERDDIKEGAFGRQFARTPLRLLLLRRGRYVHPDHPPCALRAFPTQRVGELQAIARWLAEWASTVNAYHHNLIALGDFNIDRKDDSLYQAFTSTGLTVPNALHAVPRTIFGSSTDRHYDQIAWFASDIGKVPKLSLKPTGAAGSFDFTGLVHRQLTRHQMSWRISDHLPVWVEYAH